MLPSCALSSAYQLGEVSWDYGLPHLRYCRRPQVSLRLKPGHRFTVVRATVLSACYSFRIAVRAHEQGAPCGELAYLCVLLLEYSEKRWNIHEVLLGPSLGTLNQLNLWCLNILRIGHYPEQPGALPPSENFSGGSSPRLEGIAVRWSSCSRRIGQGARHSANAQG